MHARGIIWRLAVALTALFVTAAGLATAGSAPSYPDGAAIAEAQRLLALVTLPPGSQPSSTQPGSNPALSSPAGIGPWPHLVDLHRFYVSPGTEDSVLATVQGHPPASGRSGPSGSSTGSRWISYEFGPVPGVLAARVLFITVVQLRANAVAVRVDAQVAPLPHVPASGRGPGRLRIVEAGTMLGSFAFELRCDPAGGTVPDPARICAAIHRHPRLLYSFPGPYHSCPAGPPNIVLTGVWNRRRVRAAFSVCIGGQEQSAARWAALLPSEAVEATVDVDRGIGLLALGEPERRVIDLLRGTRRPPAHCAQCTRAFPSAWSNGTGERFGWTVSFAGGKLARIVGSGPGFVAPNTSGRGWHVRRCDGRRALIHTSPKGTTTVVRGTDFQRVIVSRALVCR